MRKPWRSIVGWTILSVVAITASQHILYKTSTPQAEGIGTHALETDRRVGAGVQTPVASHSDQAVKPAMTKTERLKMNRKEEFEKAFLAAYKPPPKCKHWESNRHMVECVNHQIRAKKLFREKYYEDVEISQHIGDNWVR